MVLNVYDLDPELLFPIFYNSYYYYVFNGSAINTIVLDNTYETVINDIKSRFNGDKNPYLYAVVPSRFTKAIVRYDCPNYTPMCIIAQVNSSSKTTSQTSIIYNEIPKDYVKRYFDFLREEENSVKEGRWGLPRLDADGKKTYYVFREVLLGGGQTGIMTKTTQTPDVEVTEVIEHSNGSTTTYVYKPYYVKSKAHPNSTNYGYTLDLERKKVQRTVSTINDGIIDSRWFVHQDFLGINTIAYGHQIKSGEISSNKIQISDTEYATDWINQGLTDEQAFMLLIHDYKTHEKEVRDIIEAPRWNALPDMYKLALVEITYNGGGPRKFPKMCEAMGIPPKLGKTSWFWPSVKTFTLGPVDHDEVQAQFNRPQVSNRDQAFKTAFF